MGQQLSEPVTAKESASCQNHLYKVGSSCMQGWRVTMEDSHTHILSLPDDQEAAFFAVYDGHGGANVAQHAGNNLHKFIVQREEYKNGDITTAFKEGFLEFDNTMMRDEQMRDEVAGTTAVTLLIKGNDVYCGNVGDSRAVACVSGKEHPLSADHKPNNPMESMRIKDAGGWVEYNRVNGNLALSRALGDFVFKRNPSKTAEEQMVIALPDVEKRTITEDWEFVVLACDGVWDVLSNLECVNFIRHRLGHRMEPEKICEELMTNCLSPDCQMGGLGCDNMTVILICFLHGKSWEEYCAKIGETLEPTLEDFAAGLLATNIHGHDKTVGHHHGHVAQAHAQTQHSQHPHHEHGTEPDTVHNDGLLAMTLADEETAVNSGDIVESVATNNVSSNNSSGDAEDLKTEGKSQEDGESLQVFEELSDTPCVATKHAEEMDNNEMATEQVDE